VELVTTIGVLLSLLFVGFEIRQNTAVARAQSRNELASLTQEWLHVLSQDAVLNYAYVTYWSDGDITELTDTEMSQAQMFMTSLVVRLEATYLNYEQGLLPEEALRSYGMGAPVFASLRFRNEFWPEIRAEFNAEFVRFAESEWGM
jgi:hypothetical protein